MNAFFFNHIMPIGGTESFLYYLARKYKNREITVYYRTGDSQQLSRLQKYVRIQRYNDEPIKCDKAFFNYTLEAIDQVDAKEYIQVIHTDFKAMGIMPQTHPKLTGYIAVSQTAADSFKELTGNECEVCYNPLSIDKKDKPLLLISATRLSREKGKARIEKLANRLELEGINFRWWIFTTDKNAIQNENIEYMKPEISIAQFMPLCDWFVQLSDDCEGYGYSVVEANTMGVPCITTPVTVFKELGIQGVTVDFDVNVVPIDIIKKGMKVNFKAPADRWDEILTPEKSTYKPPKDNNLVTVTATRTYLDILIGRTVKKGYKFKVTEARARKLKERGLAE